MNELQAENLINKAIARGYMTIRGERVIYHCHREYEDNFSDPEEAVRAAVYSWLILERQYSANCIELEVPVPRRTPVDRADIVVFEDETCSTPYLVVECKARGVEGNAVEQLFGNSNSLRSKFGLFDNLETSKLFDVAGFPPTERISNHLGPRDSLVSDYGRPLTLRLIAGGSQDIRSVSARELESAVRRAHAYIWAGGARDPLMAFREWCKLLFAKVYDERWTPNGSPRGFQVGAGENESSVGSRIRQLYTDAQLQDAGIWDDPIDLPDAKIRQVVEVIQPVGLLSMDVDTLGTAFETFFSTIFRGGLGQYFTRREIARFVIGTISPDEHDVILDPTAGTGGFLLEALIQVWHRIDRDYAGRRDVERLKADFALKHLYAIELHDVLSRVCQTNMLLHQDGHSNVEGRRSALDVDFRNPDISLGKFTVVVGNPPFGDKVKGGDVDRLGRSRLSDFELANTSQLDSEILVLERSVKFLAPGGRLGMVIPDGILNNSGEGSRCPALRRFLMRTCKILAIVSLPDYAFRKAGAQNKTSLLFCEKFTDGDRNSFESTYITTCDAIGFTSAERGGFGPETDQALMSTLATHDYQVFLGEAERIGYTPAGSTDTRNDLYKLANHMPDPGASGTLLGEYQSFSINPATFRGSENPRSLGVSASDLFASHSSHRLDPKYHIFKAREAMTAVPEGTRRYRLECLLDKRHEPVVPSESPDEEFVTLTLTQGGTLEPREAGKGNNPIDWHGAYFPEGTRWFRARNGDMIISRIDVWKGCVSIIPPDFDNAIVTGEFPVYRVRDSIINPHYLKLLLRTDYFKRAMQAINTGHSNRRRVQEDDFMSLEVFLPEIDIQELVADLVLASEDRIVDEQSAFQELIKDVERCLMGEIAADELVELTRNRTS